MAVQERSAATYAGVRQWAANWPLIAVFTATVLRLILLLAPSHGYDSFAYKHWSWRLVNEPLRQFYVDDGQAFPDHLPGDLWLLKFLGHAAHFFDADINIYGNVYGVLISLLATSFDAMLALVFLRFGYAIGNQRAGRLGAIAWWCAPAPMFVASVWGQIDSIAATLGVMAVALAVRSRFTRAFVVLAICALVKPQFLMLAMPLLVAWWRSDRARTPRWLSHVAATALICTIVVAIVIAPFDVGFGICWGEWSILQRVRLASSTYPVSVLGAHNFWILFNPLSPAPGDRIPWILGVNRFTVGLLLYVACVCLAAWMLVKRWRGEITIVTSSIVMMFGFFLFATGMHERYLFPVASLCILLAIIDARYIGFAICVHTLVFLNIALRFLWPLNDDWSEWHRFLTLGGLEHDLVVQIFAMLSIAAFAWLSMDGMRKRTP